MARAVVRLFRPRHVDALSFLPGGAVEFDIEGYEVRDAIEHHCAGYRVSMRQLYRPPEAPRPAYVFPL